MTNLDRDFCLRLRNARRTAKLSQSELAQEVGCKQSALSMFEQGEPTKLNEEVVEKLAKKFGLSLHEEKGASLCAPVTDTSVKGFCPNPHCPSNAAYHVEGRTLYLPDRVQADPVGGRFCALCGEVLEKKCPNCGAPVHAGAVCSHCGEPYLAV